MAVGETLRMWIPESLAYKGAAGQAARARWSSTSRWSSCPRARPPTSKRRLLTRKRTHSGLAYEVLRPGTGTRHPTSSDKVTVNYTGWTTDGKMFDSSVARGAPSTFPLNKVIPGWTEGMQLMVEGEKVRFWIPENLAYGGKQPPFGMLVFDVELIKIQ